MFLGSPAISFEHNNGTFPNSLLKPATDTQGQVKIKAVSKYQLM
jgi:hypothetical protein